MWPIVCQSFIPWTGDRCLALRDAGSDEGLEDCGPRGFHLFISRGSEAPGGPVRRPPCGTGWVRVKQLYIRGMKCGGFELREAGSEERIEDFAPRRLHLFVFHKAWRLQEVQALTALTDRVGLFKETLGSSGRRSAEAWNFGRLEVTNVSGIVALGSSICRILQGLETPRSSSINALIADRVGPSKETLDSGDGEIEAWSFGRLEVTECL